MNLRVGLLITGDEVLSGRTKDTNGPFLGQHLRRHGVRVTQILFCGDDALELKHSLAFLAERVDVILMTGGIGPTADDLTAAVVAAAFRLPLTFSQAAWDACLSHFKALGRPDVPPANRKQALLPDGCRLLPNPHGTATGFQVSGIPLGLIPPDAPEKTLTIVALPGVPWELEPMFLNHVLPSIIPKNDDVCSFGWQVFQLGESALQQLVEPFEKALLEICGKDEVRIFYQAHPGWVTYSAQVSLPHSVYLKQVFAPAVENAISKHLIAVQELPLVEVLRQQLTRKNSFLALAESCTGGLLARMLTQTAGASATFAGGVVTYSNESKTRVLGVPKTLMETHGSTSTQCAVALALGALKGFCSEISLSITGVAGPSGGTQRAPVGSVSFAIACTTSHFNQKNAERLATFGWEPVTTELADTRIFQAHKNFGARLSRDAIQLRAAGFALGSLVVLTQELLPV